MFTSSIEKMFERKSKGLSEESITTSAASDNSLVSRLAFDHNSKKAVKFEGNCLK